MATFDEIYARMKAKYIEESGSEFLETSDIAIRLRVLAGEIYNAQTSLEWLKKQMFVNTASGENLDYLASERGLKRKEATKAKGEIMFMIPEAVDHKITIPKGAVVSTNDKTPIRFCTTETEEIGIGGTFVSDADDTCYTLIDKCDYVNWNWNGIYILVGGNTDIIDIYLFGGNGDGKKKKAFMNWLNEK